MKGKVFSEDLGTMKLISYNIFHFFIHFANSREAVPSPESPNVHKVKPQINYTPVEVRVFLIILHANQLPRILYTLKCFWWIFFERLSHAYENSASIKADLHYSSFGRPWKTCWLLVADQNNCK